MILVTDYGQLSIFVTKFTEQLSIIVRFDR